MGRNGMLTEVEGAIRMSSDTHAGLLDRVHYYNDLP
jgi:hypothetical protein